ncbi:hypothetical protein FJU08_08325 [Martelella alba]|uniref:Lipoprotein n=1 Tax=Martelella alba TaxID=2590451 RepID=A0A506UDR2_9HYPH|nr:hypothetical protein [Martelella alba]TPW31738.1 hypothetical protein FJU08_08325 [Martelella alba]
MAGKFAGLALLSITLTACTTSDALNVSQSPPQSVGGGNDQPTLVQTTPLSTTVPDDSVTSESLPPPSAAPQVSQPTTYGQAATTLTSSTAPTATTLNGTPGIGRAPSTFGAQAANIANDTPALPASQSAAVPAAATIASTGQQPAPIQQQAQQSSPPPVTTTAPARQAASLSPASTGPASTGPASSLANASSIRFLPIVGAPDDKLQPLSSRLGEGARAAGLTIEPMSDDSADLSLKGYFSAVNKEDSVAVIYVWDVMDAKGQRVHRIQGQQEVPPTKADDPWSAVSSQTMETIGQKSVADLMVWLDSQG